MLLREKYINDITDQISWIDTKVKLLNSLNLYDINVHAESFFCGLLNVVLGFQLKNLNFSERNYTSIDLGDDENRIAIQVTSERTSAKIQKTLDAFSQNSYDKTYDKLIVLIIGVKPNLPKLVILRPFYLIIF